MVSFPHHDPLWVGAAGVLRERAAPGASILAPDDFWWLFPRIHRHPHALAPGAAYGWVLVHKGAMAELSRGFLEGIVARGRAVFANEVFVLFDCTAAPADPPLPACDHLDAFFAILGTLPEAPPNAPVAGPVLPEPDIIARFDARDDPALRSAMERHLPVSVLGRARPRPGRAPPHRRSS
ncbi:MAG: hypothetical protein K2X49_03680 [Acetobacteraceae bacterium]|nr:hypothetical protein [Acetobacteraceae bacterium]